MKHRDPSDEYAPEWSDVRLQGGSSARRGALMVSGFWIVIAVLLSARVAMFDEISAVRAAFHEVTRVAALLLPLGG